MADDSNFRSYRPADQRRPAQATPTASGQQGSSDPLAELARLIGQTDPFADLKQGGSRAGAPAPARPAPAAMPPQPAQPPLRRSEATPSVPSDPYGSPLQFSRQQFDDRGAAEPQHQPAYDPAIYGTPEQQQAAGYETDAYYDDPSRMPQGEEAYEEDYAEQRPRQGMMKLVVVLAGLAVIGTGGFLGYRAIFTGGASGPPPVIKANTAPSKVVPAPAAEASNKQIYDRVGDALQGERVVSREEKPIEVKDNSRDPRVAFPGAPPSSNAQDGAMTTASPPLNTDPGGPSAAEPKKIRTVTIRADGTGSMSVPRPAAAQVPARTASAAPAPAAAPPSRPVADPNPVAQANVPLSLSAQVANAEASARSPFPPPPKPAAAAAAPTRVATVAPTAEVASGAYTVQISSQRSETEAQASFRSLQTKFPSLLSDRQPIIRRADLGDKGIYFRAMVGPFASGEQAVQFCGSLKSAGGQCVVQRN